MAYQEVQTTTTDISLTNESDEIEQTKKARECLAGFAGAILFVSFGLILTTILGMPLYYFLFGFDIWHEFLMGSLALGLLTAFVLMILIALLRAIYIAVQDPMKAGTSEDKQNIEETRNCLTGLTIGISVNAGIVIVSWLLGAAVLMKTGDLGTLKGLNFYLLPSFAGIVILAVLGILACLIRLILLAIRPIPSQPSVSNPETVV